MAQLLRCNPVESDALCGSENAEPQANTRRDFQSARHLVDYVGELAGGHDDFRIHLFHAAGPCRHNY